MIQHTKPARAAESGRPSFAGRTPRRRTLALVLVAWALFLGAATTAAQVDEDTVREAYVEALAAVEAAWGKKFEPPVPLRFVDPAEIARSVTAENLPLVLLRQADPERARLEAEQLGRQFASFAYAKYSWSTKEFLVVLDLWNLFARQLDSMELVEEETVRAVLVHELVHALDDRTLDLGTCLLHCTTTNLTLGLNAVLEGHAQHLARRICAQADWSDGFDNMDACIGAVPDGLGEGTLLVYRAQSAMLVSAYRDGERFVAALEQQGGAELVERAFREPPDAETIFHPEWFIDPSSRPSTLFDPEPALDVLAAHYPPETWTANRLSLSQAQVTAGLALLPAETAQQVTATLRGARALTLQPSAAPDSKLVVFAVLEFDSTGTAASYVVAARELGRIKDERMKTGNVRILSASYEEIHGEDESGFVAQKRMRVGQQEVDVFSLDLQHGPLVLETIVSGEPAESEANVALAREVLAKVRPR